MNVNQHNTVQDQKLWNFHQVILREHYRTAEPRYDIIAKKIQRMKRSGKVLEIGFGDGYLLKQLSRVGYQCFGVDLADENVRLTREKFAQEGLPVNFSVGNINALPYEDVSFDFVVASEVIEHLDDETLNRGIHEINRILTDGGILLVTVPADEDLKQSIVFCPNCNSAFHRWGHKQSYSKERLYEIFRDFSHTDIAKIPPIPAKTAPLIEKVKFTVRKAICSFYDQPFIGNYLVWAKK